MGFLTEMTYVEIQGDWLHGTLPPELGEWRKLKAFLINNNFIGGTFPPTFGENNMLGYVLRFCIIYFNLLILNLRMCSVPTETTRLMKLY